MESIDLPLILFLLVLGSGSVWLFDFLVLAKKRRAATEAVESSYAKLDAEARQKDEGYQVAVSAATREPLLVEYSKSFFPVLLQFWQADEEFPPKLVLLWDQNTIEFMHFETTFYLQGDLLERLKNAIK